MTFNPGDVVTVDFPGVTGIKRRPAVVLSSATYHATRPDVIIGLITSQTTALGITDYTLQNWAVASLRVASVFRSFIVTLPPSANLVLIGHLSEVDWKGVRACVKIALTELDDFKPSSNASSNS
ncbi:MULTISPECIES: type II toxin-antitoxin system PemK/MazF family toxin [unclassified Nostoc]|uniref:type II toxin-antitoxin system PemK/MazF family toxin n=1 Tax=unclassified Nostoc TaxID=2593658 RepID=UPI002AD4188C|nr:MULTISPECIES: type II toxin-antitoxin system PemK/MazF family toxin [unclassified Nostoc]MDZ8122717.1 type II toxin-antitoxin system PemK/MazF family toxin [Nostoc sp. CmiVER01]MDZ8226840.1 type II toxin-antitoxin system PemK/MazF family toxin [Nostoc sp. ChiVER01]